MKNYFTIIILTLVLNSCGKSIASISLKDKRQHSKTLKLKRGDKVRFWSKIKYKTEIEPNKLSYSVKIYRNRQLYEEYHYNPLHTNPRYLSSTEKWVISKKKNPDWIRYNENRLTIFGWVKNEDEREDFQKQKHIIKYGIKKNVKGKNLPVFHVKHDDTYTFKAKLNIEAENSFMIKKAELILRK
jgi:hypothetical protein